MRRIGYSLLVAAGLLTLVQVFLYSSNLPQRVASHFGQNGAADGWMTRSSFLALHLGLQASCAALLLAIARFGRFLPDSLLSMPHKDYWLHADRRESTLEYTEALLTCIAGVTATFLSVVFQCVYQANVNGTEKLSTAVFLPALMAYIGIVFYLVVRSSLRFASAPTGSVVEGN